MQFITTSKLILVTYCLDLCIIHDERTILDPRKVMLALSFYVSSFKLTRQQVVVKRLSHSKTSHCLISMYGFLSGLPSLFM